MIANGRSRKKRILYLEEEGRQVTDRKEIQENIYSFYKKLFGIQVDKNVHLKERVWAETNRLSDEENLHLLRPFSEEEVEVVIVDGR